MNKQAQRRAGIHIGISGWNYPAWRRGFYAGLQQRQWLAHAAAHFSGLEINATFFRFMRPDIVEGWAEAAPPDFVFTAKGHRFVTHGQRLDEVAEHVARMRSSLVPLRGKLRVVLWQAPQNLEKDADRLDRFADILESWSEVRHAIEFRHPSWFDDEIAQMLEQRKIANCLAIDAEWPAWDLLAAGLAYLRFYSHPPGSAPRDLDFWQNRIQGWRKAGQEVHAYFDADPGQEAPHDALKLQHQLAETA